MIQPASREAEASALAPATTSPGAEGEFEAAHIVSRARTLFQDFFLPMGLALCFGLVFARRPPFRASAASFARSALHSAQRAVIRSLRALRPAAEMRDFLRVLRART